PVMRALLRSTSLIPAEPPGPSRSTIVTSAPTWGATRSASEPPGPRPTITTRDTADILTYRSPVAPGAAPTLVAMALYTAYGSNMDPRQMADRAPHSPMAGTGWLDGWRLTFGGADLGWEGALATVVEEQASQVFVVLYDLT